MAHGFFAFQYLQGSTSGQGFWRLVLDAARRLGFAYSRVLCLHHLLDQCRSCEPANSKVIPEIDSNQRVPVMHTRFMNRQLLENSSSEPVSWRCKFLPLLGER